MGGAVKSIAQTVGLGSKAPAAQAVQSIVDRAASEKPKASRMDEEQGARMRGARRRGRQLLSDARLNAESGMETLGGGQSLG
jgi:hypothetical protein